MHTDLPASKIRQVCQGIWHHQPSATYGFASQSHNMQGASYTYTLRIRWHAHLSDDINDPVPTNDGYWPDLVFTCPGWDSLFIYVNPRHVGYGGIPMNDTCLLLMNAAVAPGRLMPLLAFETTSDLDREDYVYGCRMIAKHRLQHGILINL
jgi:hypothetical protein